MPFPETEMPTHERQIFYIYLVDREQHTELVKKKVTFGGLEVSCLSLEQDWWVQTLPRMMDF
jgi:hypothetical protein